MCRTNIFCFAHFFIARIYYIVNTYILLGGVFLNNNNNFDIAQMMNMLSKMDKKELDANLSKVSKMLNSKDADNIINQIRKNNNI